ncbi:MAG: multidrug ABC transporter ATP-binding protein [Spirochaetae bacterium HGW-Spirochaetae-8]|nr:MAG: multidrug ABC transporter ATP-binding protein [Spirochaetae bacterium HGW-Spirochaetae-8]
MRGPGGPGMRGFGVPVQKPKNFKQTTRTLLKRLAPFRLAILFVLVAALGSTVFAIAGPKILGHATTEIFTGMIGKFTGGPGIDFTAIARILVLLILLYGISSILSFIQGYVMSTITQKVSYTLRKEISEKINRMPMKSLDAITHGEILSRVTNDIDTLSQNLNQGLVQVITSSATLVGVLVMMLSISWLMTLVTVVILPLSFIFISRIVKLSQKYFVQQQAALGQVNGQVEEVYGGHAVVKAFNGEAQVVETFNQTNEKLYHSAWKSQFLSGLMMPVMNGIGDLGYVAVALLGGVLVIKQTISVGDIQAFIQYMRNFTQPIVQVAQVSNMLQATIAASERVFEFLDGEEELDEATICPLDKLQGNVAFNHVRFGYAEDKTIIQDFSVNVRKGQKVAIVGPTGAGKTTMVKLLMRFYDVNSGSITVDGHDIRSLSRGDLRKQFGMVLQDAWLFNGTIRENIRYGRLSATDEEVVEAAKAARIHHFIQTLPDGYDMVINEESTNISQGQKQLITIARAILADPGLMILDEATSSVDTRTEILIQEAMDHIMHNRTSFIIAHRLSTIRNADLILVMRDGDIVEQGSHEELLAANGFYASMYNAQFERMDEVVNL